MMTKTFKADTMLETLQKVQAELGANAIVVSMREVPLGPLWNPWQKTAVEIVAAMPEGAPVTQPAPQPMMAPVPAPAPAAVLRQAENPAGVEFVEERPEIEWALTPDAKLPPPLKLKLAPMPGTATAPAAALVTVSAPQAEPAPKMATKAAAVQSDRYTPPSLKKIQERLLQQGVETSLIEGLINVALETLSPTTLADAEVCKKSLAELMSAELSVQKGAGAFVSSHVLCVVGASGSGKTSTVAKLALYFSQTLHKTVTWVCADTVRMGAIAEARAYTDALGLTLKLVYTPADLGGILGDAQPDELFLVDTPGYNPCNESQVIELGALLSEMPRRCTYLVAPATTKETDLFQAAAALGIFHLDGLIVTKLDETHSFGSLYNFARRNQVPLSFMTTGKEAARHLEVADPARLVAALFGKDWNK